MASICAEIQDGVAEFDRLFSPLFDGVSFTARRRLELAIQRGVAPSPFCEPQHVQ